MRKSNVPILLPMHDGRVPGVSQVCRNVWVDGATYLLSLPYPRGMRTRLDCLDISHESCYFSLVWRMAALYATGSV